MVHAKDLFLTPIGSLPLPLSGDVICAAIGRQVGMRPTLPDSTAGLLTWQKAYSAADCRPDRPARQFFISCAPETSVVAGTPCCDVRSAQRAYLTKS